jgi:hypothetical protein
LSGTRPPWTDQERQHHHLRRDDARRHHHRVRRFSPVSKRLAKLPGEKVVE